MYNPFAIISAPLINAMMASPKFFVREHFPRGIAPFDEDDMVSLLFTYYEKSNDVEANRASIHMAQITQDPYRFLYDTDNPDHRARLINACQPSKKYRIYINLLYHKWEPPDWLRKKIHAFMMHHYAWWHYDKKNQLHIHLKDRYGKLYLHLSWKANSADLNLEEIENYSPCVTT